MIPPPGLCRLDDGFGLFYEGRINGIHGEPECGKSWVAWVTVAQTLQRGGSAIYLDYEDSEQGAATRLQALGVCAELALSDRFAYVRPEEQANGEWARLLGSRPWDVVIVDSTNEAMSMEGLNPNDNHDSAVFLRKVVRPIAECGAAAILLDHVSKSKETRGNWAIGAQQKRAMIRGASYLVESSRPFGRGLEGEATLTVVKDTPGAIRERRGGNNVAARLVLLSAPETGRITYSLTVPPTPHQVVLDRIRAFLLTNPGASKRQLRTLSNSDLVDELVEKCVVDGRIDVQVTGTAHAHFWVEQ